MRRSTWLGLAAVAALVVYWYMEQQSPPQASHSIRIVSSSPPFKEPGLAPVAPSVATATQSLHYDTIPAAEATPLIAGVRSYMSYYAHFSVVDERPFPGRRHAVLVRAVAKDTTNIRFEAFVTDSAMESVERRGPDLAAPWPDLAMRIERVTEDSVYLTGTSAAYGRTISRALPWKWSQPYMGRPASALSAPACGAVVRVDLNARTIAGIWMNQPIEDIKREVGAANVTAHPIEVEGGETDTSYVIMLCGHEIHRTWNGASWTDPAFRTAEGLGVGSPLAAFDSVHGVGEAIGEEGNSVRYWPIEGTGHFFVDVDDGCYSITGGAAPHWNVDRKCRATGISFIVFSK